MKLTDYQKSFISEEDINSIENKIWVTKDGTNIKLCNMTINHIINCIIMLKDGGWYIKYIWLKIFIKELENRFKIEELNRRMNKNGK